MKIWDFPQDTRDLSPVHPWVLPLGRKKIAYTMETDIQKISKVFEGIVHRGHSHQGGGVKLKG